MYDVDGTLPDGRTVLDAGTTLLVTGDAQSTHELTLDLLAKGPSNTEAAILVSTNESAAEVISALEERNVLDSDLIGILDCTSGDEPRTAAAVPVAYLSSPADLTGISLEFAKLVDRLEPAELRVGLSTISTLLMYTDVETTFRFLHVFCSRIRSGGWLGVFTLDPAMHDSETTNTIRTLFDGEVAVDEAGLELRGV